MSKQDRQGARTPANLEQKYSFGRVFSRQERENARQNEEMNQQNLTLNQFISLASVAIETLQKDMIAANNSIKSLSESDTSLQNQIKEYWETVYPVGHIYLSISNKSPENLFGGTWKRIEDRFLLTAGSTYAAGSTGGEAEHKLTVDEMPSHSHEIKTVQVASGGDYSGVSSGTGFSVGESGGSKPHNNMPPYLTVYAWQRTA